MPLLVPGPSGTNPRGREVNANDEDSAEPTNPSTIEIVLHQRQLQLEAVPDSYRPFEEEGEGEDCQLGSSGDREEYDEEQHQPHTLLLNVFKGKRIPRLYFGG